jgi:hypothetical protein
MNLTRQTITIRAVAGSEEDSQDITVTIKQLSTRLTLAQVPELHLTEDEPFVLDLLPYLYNVGSNVGLVVLTESPYVTVGNVTELTITYPGGIPADEFVVTVQAGTQFAQGTVRVLVSQRDDAPRLLQALTNFTAAPGATVTWDLTQFFTDEEHPELLRFIASDPRVVIDNQAKTARLVAPGSGAVSFTITAIDGEDANLTVTSPNASVTVVAGGPGAGHGLVATGDDGAGWILWPFLLGAALLLLLAHRATRGAAWGASSEHSIFRRRGE